jgi:hypothetical protein
MKLPRGSSAAAERWRRVSRPEAAMESTPAKAAAATMVRAGATGEGTPLEHDESVQPAGRSGSATVSGVKTSGILALTALFAGTPASERSAFGIKPMTTMAANGPKRHQRHARDMVSRLRADSRRVSSGSDVGISDVDRPYCAGLTPAKALVGIATFRGTALVSRPGPSARSAPRQDRCSRRNPAGCPRSRWWSCSRPPACRPAPPGGPPPPRRRPPGRRGGSSRAG